MGKIKYINYLTLNKKEVIKMELVIDKNELKILIKEAIREVIEEQKIDFFLNSLPPVSNDEMNDIKKLYKKSAKKQIAFIDEIKI